MFANIISGETSPKLQSSKRRVRGNKVKKYFDVREEMAVKMFLTANTFNEKNQIYDDYLRAPFDKMIESIIRRYKLYRKDMNFSDIHTDTHSFLITKVDKFDPERNKKAYSYFGTICKNYLMGQIIKDQKDQNRKISYEDITSKIENRPDMVYYIEYEKVTSEQVIENFIGELHIFIEENDLNHNEIKLGYALIEIFDNYDDIFIGSDNNKFNKNIILLSLREMTKMTTKEIRTSMRKYKNLYFDMLNKLNSQ